MDAVNHEIWLQFKADVSDALTHKGFRVRRVEDMAKIGHGVLNNWTSGRDIPGGDGFQNLCRVLGLTPANYPFVKRSRLAKTKQRRSQASPANAVLEANTSGNADGSLNDKIERIEAKLSAILRFLGAEKGS